MTQEPTEKMDASSITNTEGERPQPAAEHTADRHLCGHLALIEDNEVYAQLFSATLASQPALVLTHFNHVDQALAAPAKTSFDLWVIDRHVGGDDTLERFPELLQRFGPLRAVLYTSDTAAETRAAALRAGFLDHWNKPMPPTMLLEELRRWLQIILPNTRT